MDSSSSSNNYLFRPRHVVLRPFSPHWQGRPIRFVDSTAITRRIADGAAAARPPRRPKQRQRRRGAKEEEEAPPVLTEIACWGIWRTLLYPHELVPPTDPKQSYHHSPTKPPQPQDDDERLELVMGFPVDTPVAILHDTGKHLLPVQMHDVRMNGLVAVAHEYIQHHQHELAPHHEEEDEDPAKPTPRQPMVISGWGPCLEEPAVNDTSTTTTDPHPTTAAFVLLQDDTDDTNKNQKEPVVQLKRTPEMLTMTGLSRYNNQNETPNESAQSPQDSPSATGDRMDDDDEEEEEEEEDTLSIPDLMQEIDQETKQLQQQEEQLLEEEQSQSPTKPKLSYTQRFKERKRRKQLLRQQQQQTKGQAQPDDNGGKSTKQSWAKPMVKVLFSFPYKGQDYHLAQWFPSLYLLAYRKLPPSNRDNNNNDIDDDDEEPYNRDRSWTLVTDAEHEHLMALLDISVMDPRMPSDLDDCTKPYEAGKPKQNGHPGESITHSNQEKDGKDEDDPERERIQDMLRHEWKAYYEQKEQQRQESQAQSPTP